MASPSGVTEAPFLGSFIHVIPRYTDSLYIGKLQERDDDRLLMEMREPYFLKSRGGVLLVCTAPGERIAADAIVHDPYSPAGATFLRSGDWWRIDTRESERFAVRLRTRVLPQQRVEEVVGLTIDLSLGGAAIEVPEMPASRDQEVLLGFGSDPQYLPCRVVDAVAGSSTTVLRVRFEGLTRRQRTYLFTLVESVRAA